MQFYEVFLFDSRVAKVNVCKEQTNHHQDGLCVCCVLAVKETPARFRSILFSKGGDIEY